MSPDARLRRREWPKPIEYVKICSIYGAGFFYIPGTDTCIKIGGWVRAEYGFQTGNSSVQYNQGAAGLNNRINSNEYNMRARWVTSIDVRTQTEYGTLRAYSRAGFQTTTGESTQGRIYTERGFIQFAGFTFGKSQSYFDFFGGAFCYGCSYTGTASMTGAAGTLLASYTATFGNGFTATLSLEDQTMRRNGIWDAGTDALVISNQPGPVSVQDSYQLTAVNTGDQAATQIPDIVGSLRVDQAWGSAQIAGALHQNRAGYYGNNTTGAGPAGPGGFTGLAPSDAYGWAAMAGVVINLPWAKGDKFYVEATVAEGAGAYVGMDGGISGKNNTFGRFNGRNVAAAWAIDSIFANVIGPTANPIGALGGSGQQLTRYFTVTAALEHYWTPALRSDLWGNYTAADYNDVATQIFCSSPVGPVRTAAGATPNFATGPVIGCNPDWNTWAVGLRTIWNPAPQFDIGLEVYYTRVEQKHDPNTVLLSFAGSGGRAAGFYQPSNESVWGSILRLQRNFWP
jgi:porin-like protein